MKIIQLFFGTLYDDGVGNTVQIMDDHLKAAGYETEILNLFIEPSMLKNGFFNEDDIIFYHLSVRMDPLLQFVKCRKVLVFHNITYPELLIGLNLDSLRMDCACGMYELNDTKNQFVEAIAFSEFSRNTLVAHGWEKERIHVLVNTVKQAQLEAEADKETIEKYSDGITNILFTGRVFPNKKQEDIIRSFEYYKRNYNEKSRLFLVGAVKSDQYSFFLRDLVKKCGLEDSVHFLGFLKWSEYLAYYYIANLYLCMSAHEGFCRPLLEAMYLKVPILAVNETAVPDTLGDGGVLVNSREPSVVAGEIDKIIRDKQLSKALIERGFERYKKLSGQSGAQVWIETLKEIVAKTLKTEATCRTPSDTVLWETQEKTLELSERFMAFPEKDIVIYGMGAKGKELIRRMTEETSLAITCVCDKRMESLTENDAEYYCCTPDEAVSRYPSARFVITVQDKLIAVEIASWLTEKGIATQDIFIYESDVNRIR